MNHRTAVKLTNPPNHVAIIMDGNGRWAHRRGLPRIAGHHAGTENLRQIISSSVEFGIKYLTIYAFSTENWGRPQDEVDGLMSILADVIDRELNELNKEGVRLYHIGRIERLQGNLQKKVLDAMELTRNNSRLFLQLAWNYGGRDEISVHRRHTRPRSGDSYFWRNAHQQFFDLAGGIFGMVRHPHTLAGF